MLNLYLIQVYINIEMNLLNRLYVNLISYYLEGAK